MTMKCETINAGQFRHIINFEQQSEIPDGGGGFTNDWVTVVPWVQAKITPKGGNETFSDGRLEHNISHEILIRYSSTISPKMRVLYRGRYFQIRGLINVEEMDRWLLIKCEEGVVT